MEDIFVHSGIRYFSACHDLSYQLITLIFGNSPHSAIQSELQSLKHGIGESSSSAVRQHQNHSLHLRRIFLYMIHFLNTVRKLDVELTGKRTCLLLSSSSSGCCMYAALHCWRALLLLSPIQCFKLRNSAWIVECGELTKFKVINFDVGVLAATMIRATAE